MTRVAAELKKQGGEGSTRTCQLKSDRIKGACKQVERVIL